LPTLQALLLFYLELCSPDPSFTPSFPSSHSSKRVFW
jgi:hypothetical protein